MRRTWTRRRGRGEEDEDDDSDDDWWFMIHDWWLMIDDVSTNGCSTVDMTPTRISFAICFHGFNGKPEYYEKIKVAVFGLWGTLGALLGCALTGLLDEWRDGNHPWISRKHVDCDEVEQNHGIDTIDPWEEKKEAAGNSHSPSGSNEASKCFYGIC